MPAVTLPVVVWSEKDKRVASCSVSIDTTFQDVIDGLFLGNIKSALVGHRNVPFKLMAGDFAPDDDYEPHHKNTCLADTFTGKVVDIVFWMAYIGDGPITEGKAILLDEKEQIQANLAEMLDGYQIHLFSYDHRQDCTDGPESFFTERDPSTTTAQSSLWLRLEQEFIRGDRPDSFHGWTHMLQHADMHSTIRAMSALLRVL